MKLHAFSVSLSLSTLMIKLLDVVVSMYVCLYKEFCSVDFNAHTWVLKDHVSRYYTTSPKALHT